MSTVLVTGAGGFIARSLAPVLAAAGHRVVGVTSGVGVAVGYDRVLEARLGDSLRSVFESEAVDAVIHAANHTGKNEYEINVTGTTGWLEEAQAAGAVTQVFLSTLSAPGGASDYARAKLELERRFVARHGVCFRLGVVVGDGGMFARMRDSVRRLPLLPLLDNGKAPVFVLGIDYLCRVVRDCLAAPDAYRSRVWHLQQPERHTLREVLSAIRAAYGFRCVFVPVPSLPMLWAVTVAEAMGVKLPVGSTNIRGLRRGEGTDLPSDFAHFGYPATPLRELVQAAARADRSAQT